MKSFVSRFSCGTSWTSGSLIKLNRGKLTTVIDQVKIEGILEVYKYDMFSQILSILFQLGLAGLMVDNIFDLR